MTSVDKAKLNEIERAIDGVSASERGLNDVYRQFFRHIDGFPTLAKHADGLEQVMLEDRKVAQTSVRRFQHCSENLAAGKKLGDVERELKAAKADCRRDTEHERDALHAAVQRLRDELRQLDRDCEKFLDLTKREFDVRLETVR